MELFAQILGVLFKIVFFPIMVPFYMLDYFLLDGEARRRSKEDQAAQEELTRKYREG